MNITFRQRLIGTIGCTWFWFPKHKIETFLNHGNFLDFIIGCQRISGDEELWKIHREGLKYECEKILRILVPVLNTEEDYNHCRKIDTGIFKSIFCVNLYPILKDEEKYNVLKELMTAYIREFSDAGFLYYEMGRCLMNSDEDTYEKLLYKSRQIYPYTHYESRGSSLRKIIESSQYTLLKLHPWLLFFVDVDDIMVSDKHLRIVAQKLGNQIHKFNNMPDWFLRL